MGIHALDPTTAAQNVRARGSPGSQPSASGAPRVELLLISK